MTNKKLGNSFEAEFCELLSDSGFWVHNFAPSSDGQPADVIAVRNGKAYLIDCKVCSTSKGFDLTRVEANQALAMGLWKECGNGSGWFAVKYADRIVMLPSECIAAYREHHRTMSPDFLDDYTLTLDLWVKLCALL